MKLPNPTEKYDELLQKKASRDESVYAFQQLADQWLAEKREKKAIDPSSKAGKPAPKKSLGVSKKGGKKEFLILKVPITVN